MFHLPNSRLNYYQTEPINILPLGKDHIYDSLRMYTEILEKELDSNGERNNFFAENQILSNLKQSIAANSSWIDCGEELFNEILTSIAKQNLFLFAARQSPGIETKALELSDHNDYLSFQIKALLLDIPKSAKLLENGNKDEHELRRLRANKLVNEKLIAKLHYKLTQLELMLIGNQKVTQLSNLLQENIQLKDQNEIYNEFLSRMNMPIQPIPCESRKEESKEIISFTNSKANTQGVEAFKEETKKNIEDEFLNEIESLANEFHKKGNLNSIPKDKYNPILLEIFKTLLLEPYSQAKKRALQLEDELRKIEIHANSFEREENSREIWLNEQIDTLEKETNFYKKENIKLKLQLEGFVEKELDKVYTEVLEQASETPNKLTTAPEPFIISEDIKQFSFSTPSLKKKIKFAPKLKHTKEDLFAFLYAQAVTIEEILEDTDSAF